MKLVKEAKVGLLGIVSLSILYLGFNYLKGMDVFSTVNEYHVVYDNVQGLQNSNPVSFKGVTVGRVMLMETDQENNRVNVVLAINKSIVLTDQSVAILADDGLIGGKLIRIEVKPGNEIGDGDYLIGESAEGIVALAMNAISPALSNVDSLVLSLTKIVNQFDETGYALNALIASAHQSTNSVNAIMASNAENIEEITSNAAKLTSNLNDLSVSLDSQLTPILTNTNEFTSNLNNLELDQTINNLNASIAGLQGIIEDINNGNGTLGKLTTDDSLYVNLDRSAASLDALLSDLKEHPKRYVRFSIFGGKDKSEKKE